MQIDRASMQVQQDFYASKKSGMNLTRLSLWGGAVLGIAISTASSKNGFSWFVAIFIFGFVGLLDWFLRKQMLIGKVFVSVDASGIASAAFNGKLKRYDWKDVTEVVVTRVQNHPMLQLVLKVSPEFLDKRSFWTGRNDARPMLPLSALDQTAQNQLVNAIQHQMQSSSFAGSPPKVDNQLAQEREFQDRLKSLAPVPWVTYGLIAINSAIWLTSLVYGAGVGASPSDLLLRWGGNAASEVQRGEWWRMGSAMFLHSGLMHVALNMLGLYSVGVTVERIYGHRLYALIYLGSGLFGSALSLHFSAQQAVSVGASGAVFGVTGALLIALLQHRKQLPRTLGKQTLGSAAFFIIYALIQGFSKPGIDNAAHVGGLLAGCLLGYILPERFDLEKYVRTYKNRALAGIMVTACVTAGLANLAPTAQLDQRGGLFFAEGMRKMSDVLNAIKIEAEQVKAGKLSERESDDRSREVFAPLMRDAMTAFEKSKLPETDPRQPLATDARRMAALILESLEMASVYEEGSSKPKPADPQRMADIEKEIQLVSQHFAILQANLQNGKKP